MNFGHKIALVYTLFVVFIIGLVVTCIKQKDIFLVSSDYYKKEIAYQEEIDKHENTKELSAPVAISKASGTVNFGFPKEMEGASGEIYFYRPANANLDFKVNLNVDETASQKVAVDHLVKGLWVIKLEWSKDGITYLKEEKLVL